MNKAQKPWWTQAKSDHALFVLLRQKGCAECHLLHYLQMATEKLSKADLWRNRNAPPKSHSRFVRFLKSLLDRPGDELDRIAEVFEYGDKKVLDRSLIDLQPLAYELQKIAPAEAGDGPNAEYPWPHESPLHCPSDHKFALWKQLTDTAQGRKLMAFVGRAIDEFDAYA